MHEDSEERLMCKKRKKSMDHYNKIESEILREKVNEIFQDHPL